MTGKGCTPAVYWLNAFVLDAAETDIHRPVISTFKKLSGVRIYVRFTTSTIEADQRNKQGRPAVDLRSIIACELYPYLAISDCAAQLWIMPLPEPVISPAFMRSLVTAATQLENVPWFLASSAQA